jgi:sarcosine oxidase
MNHPGEVVDPDEALPGATEAEVEPLRRFARRHFPAGAGRTHATSECLFTNTPDEHFIIDTHPEDDRVVIGSACSGHGFKFATVVGETLADLATEGTTKHPVGFLRMERFRGLGATATG